MRKIKYYLNIPACPHQWFEIGKVVKKTEPTISATNAETKNVIFDYVPDQAYTITYSYVDAPDLPPSAYNQVIGIKIQCANCYEVRELTGENGITRQQ